MLNIFGGKKPQHEKGQILLVVVLTMIVALTVGLSIASRIVTEVKLSKQNEESQRAFQAAEAGIEQTIKAGTGVGTSNSPKDAGNNASFYTAFLASSGQTIVINKGNDVDQGVGADVWLSDYNSDPAQNFQNPMGGGVQVTTTLYWGSQEQNSCNSTGGDAVEPALEVVLLTSAPAIQRFVFDTSDCAALGRISGSNITTGGAGDIVSGISFKNKATLQFTNGLIMKVIPIFNSGPVALVSSGPDFPSQGSAVESTGNSGDTVRKVVYYKSLPQMPLEVFPYSLLSQ